MELRTIELSEVTPHPNNPRVHPDSAISKLEKSIKTFGWTNPILLSKDGYILAGHARSKAAEQAGIEEVPAIVLDLEGPDADAYLVADNRLQDETDWDNAKLKDLLEELDNGSYDLELTGFDMDEIESLMTQYFDEEEIKEDDFDVDEATDQAKEDTRTEQGDIWQLGNHKLIVGDATNENDILALMGNKEADMIFTDPPYNVDYEGNNKMKIQNDSMEQNEFYQFIKSFYDNAFNVTKEGGPIYVCHADKEWYTFRKCFVDSGFELKQCLVWAKNNFVLGRQDYQWKHEPILYGWKPGSSHKWYGGRKQTTVQEDPIDLSIQNHDNYSILTFNTGVQTMAIKVPEYEILHDDSDEVSSIWRIEKPQKSADHPTMKPIKLCARAIMNSSKRREIVLDPFGGSGSTLIACEQTERYCRTIEFDPIYADVIIDRWEELTGQEAVKIT